MRVARASVITDKFEMLKGKVIDRSAVECDDYNCMKQLLCVYSTLSESLKALTKSP